MPRTHTQLRELKKGHEIIAATIVDSNLSQRHNLINRWIAKLYMRIAGQ
jgi:hypothetical protein